MKITYTSEDVSITTEFRLHLTEPVSVDLVELSWVTDNQVFFFNYCKKLSQRSKLTLGSRSWKFWITGVQLFQFKLKQVTSVSADPNLKIFSRPRRSWVCFTNTFVINEFINWGWSSFDFPTFDWIGPTALYWGLTKYLTALYTHFTPTPTKHSITLSSHGYLLSLQSQSPSPQVYIDLYVPSIE